MSINYLALSSHGKRHVWRNSRGSPGECGARGGVGGSLVRAPPGGQQAAQTQNSNLS